MFVTKAAAIASLALGSSALAQNALGEPTRISYQGLVEFEGSRFEGSLRIQFDIYDAEVGGNLVASSSTIEMVSNGLLDTTLNCPADALGSGASDDRRWLQISVAPEGPTQLVPLTGRQPLSSAPSAAVDIGDDWAILPSGGIVTDRNPVLVNRDFTITSEEQFGVHSDTFDGFGGMYVSTAGSGGQPFYGYSAGGDVDAYQWFSGATGFMFIELPFGRVGFSPSGEVSAEEFRYQNPQFRAISYGKEAFDPNRPADYIATATGDYGYITNPGVTTSLITPVHLPQGAVVTRVRFVVADTNATFNMQGQLYRTPNYTFNSRDILAVANSSGIDTTPNNPVTLVDNSINNEIIDNLNYSYVLLFTTTTGSWPGNDSIGVRSAVIEYEIDQPD